MNRFRVVFNKQAGAPGAAWAIGARAVLWAMLATGGPTAVRADLLYTTLSPSNGPAAGGNRVAITNCIPAIGAGDITNVMVGGVSAGVPLTQGTNWVHITMPAHAAGMVDIVVQSASLGATSFVSAYTYNPAGQIGGYTDDWSAWGAAPSLPMGLVNMATAVFSNKIYVIGGQAGGISTNLVFSYNGATWTAEPSLPTNVYWASAAVYGDYLYTIGGKIGSTGNSTNVYRFDGTTWTAANALPDSRSFVLAMTNGGYLYAMGGTISGNLKTNVYRFDGAAWTQVAGLPVANASMAGDYLHGDYYFAGGGWPLGVKTNAYLFDGTGFTEKSGLPEGRYYSGAATLGDHLYYFGGLNPANQRTNTTYRFDGTNWTSGAPLPQNINSQGSARFQEHIFSIGGKGDVSGYLTNVYCYPALQFELGVTPSNGSCTGGYSVVISGTNLSDGTLGDVTNVTLCGATAVVTGVAGSTQIVVTAGAGTSGTGDVRVCSVSFGETVKSNAFTYLKADQTIAFPAIADQSATSMVGLAATASSGLPVEFTVTAGPAYISDGTNLGFTGTGQVSVVASQAGNTSWNPAPNVTNTFTVTKAAQTIAFPAIADQAVTSVVALAATASSGLPVSFIVAGGPGVISSNVPGLRTPILHYNLSFTGTGTVWVAASQAGDNLCNPAPTVTNSVRVLGNSPSPTNTLPAPGKVAAQTEGSTNVIHVTWQGVTGATSYQLWRNTANNPAGATLIVTVPANQSVRNQRSEVRDQRSDQRTTRNTEHRTSNVERRMDQSLNHSISDSLTFLYDDYAVLSAVTYYYWVKAVSPDGASPFSYAAIGALQQGPDGAEGTADLAAYDLVFLPVNLTNGTPAGTVSCRLANLGPDSLASVPVAFDFYLTGPDDYAAWIGSDTETVTLGAGEEGLLILTPTSRATLRALGDLSATNTVQVHARHVTRRYDPDLANNTATGPGLVRVKPNGVNSLGRSLNDYDGDGKAEGVVVGANDGVWHLALSGARYESYVNLGTTFTDYRNVPGDYDGDGLADPGIYDPVTGWWYVRLSSQPDRLTVLPFGVVGFEPVPADYDGDGKTDPALYSAALGAYWVGLKSGSGYQAGELWLGGTGYLPVVGDYDGDGKADPAAYSEQTGEWQIALSSRGYQNVSGTFGGTGFAAAPADYDGDGVTDPAIYQRTTGVWYFLLSNWSPDLRNYAPAWGAYGDAQAQSVPMDFDGDGKADPATYLPATGVWKIYPSSLGYPLATGVYGGLNYTPARE